MTQLTWLLSDLPPDFPDVQHTLDEPDGLLAIGGSLAPNWLLLAYKKGIFPWFSVNDPIMWWSPSPRMVLFPGTVHISRTLKKLYKRSNIEVTINLRFQEVINNCALIDRRDDGTWITQDMIDAYVELHTIGWAHSIEVWQDGALVGGLYGIGMENCFFGESMFSKTNSASKFALVALSEWAETKKLTMIDCQLYNPYLDSMGAVEVDREDFQAMLPQDITRLSMPTNDEINLSLTTGFNSDTHV